MQVLLEQVVFGDMRKMVECTVASLLEELSNILRGVYLIRDLSIKTTDAIVKYGERLSSAIISGVIDVAALYDAREFIKTRNPFDTHSITFEV